MQRDVYPYSFSTTKRRDGVVIRAFVSQSVNLGFTSQFESYKRTLKTGIHSFQAWSSAHRESVRHRPASMLVVSMSNILNRTPPSLCGSQVVGPPVYPSWFPQSN